MSPLVTDARILHAIQMLNVGLITHVSMAHALGLATSVIKQHFIKPLMMKRAGLKKFLSIGA